MWTYTSSVAPANANKTYWEYDPATGLLWHKKDHLLRTTSYEYYSGTRLLQKRLWQRTVPIAGTPRLTTTYSYDKGGLLSKVEYNDGTPTTLVTYDRASRKTGVIDAAGSTGYSLSDGGFALNENISASTSANLLAGYWITRTKDAYGRPSSVYASGPPLSMVGGNPSYSGYTYDPATGRVASLARQSNGTPYVYGTSVSVAYVPDSDHVQTWTSGNWKQTFGYDENGRLNQAMAAKYSGANPIPADTLGYYYGYDALNRRNLITREDGSFWDIGYNTRSEVTAAKQRRGAGSSNYLPGRQFTYAYDNLGDRTTAKSGGVTSGSEASLRTTTYAAASALNQYSLITNPSTFDVTGISLTPANYNPSDSATEPVAVKVGTGAQLKATTRNPSTASTYARWHRESTSTVTTGSQARVDSVTVYENGTVKNTGKMSLPAPSQSLAYDVDGNLTDDGVWLYTWDGENRLKSMEHKDYGGSASKLYYKLTFDYDSQSRRIRKQVQTKTTFGGAWGGATSHLFVYDEWNLLLWVNGSVAKQGYHWLPDMSGTWQGAGGVRGLVGISYKDQGGAAYYWSLNVGYDGNGNVVGLYGDVGGSTGLYAVYEYDPFGNTIRQNVTPAGNSLATTLGENPFRFSTKFTDDESKLIYYGYRYYSAGLGRWLNRDPSGEHGGLSLYGFIGNNSGSLVDVLGLAGFEIRDSGAPFISVKKSEIVIVDGHGSADTPMKFYTGKNPQKDQNRACGFVGCESKSINDAIDPDVLLPGSPKEEGDVMNHNASSAEMLKNAMELGKKWCRECKCKKVAIELYDYVEPNVLWEVLRSPCTEPYKQGHGGTWVRQTRTLYCDGLERTMFQTIAMYAKFLVGIPTGRPAPEWTEFKKQWEEDQP